jgi:hypothetical protein
VTIVYTGRYADYGALRESATASLAGGTTAPDAPMSNAWRQRNAFRPIADLRPMRQQRATRTMRAEEGITLARHRKPVPTYNVKDPRGLSWQGDPLDASKADDAIVGVIVCIAIVVTGVVVWFALGLSQP